MAIPRSNRKHEVSFCADVKSWSDALFRDHPEWPFGEVRIEDYGRGNNKRQDLRILHREHGTPILCGEVKMPGTSEGRTPYDPGLMRDASQKADNIQCRYFFTWNVNTFVLFDRSHWDRPLLERRVKPWDLGLGLTHSGECNEPSVQSKIRDKFLPQFFEEFSAIIGDKVSDWGLKPDEFFIRSLESHLDWPVVGTRDYLTEQCEKDKVFAGRLFRWLTEDLQWNFDTKDERSWKATLDRAAHTLCYIFCNRAIFYEAIRARYPDELRELKMPPTTHDCHRKYAYFRNRFAEAVEQTGDYEPVFFPQVEDAVGALVFGSLQACHGWKGVLANLDQYNFRTIPHDVIGGIFQKLIAPEERQRFGQFFTHEDIVDVINAFCIRRAGDTVLDPACGSGSFLVRAYHRKAWLGEHRKGGRRHHDNRKTHEELLQETFGCDIALFPAHLATLNLAARQIEDMDNYPMVRRGNFFEVIENPETFYSVPFPDGKGGKVKRPVKLPELDAVVGNPPYVRQELVPRMSAFKRSKGENRKSYESRIKTSKDHLQKQASMAWPGLKLSGRSDLHCYFWPMATRHLKEGGYFGFLTSSSWLDVEYGFALQGWLLSNFRLIAVIESVDEPWFEDARVKTCATIVQRCADDEKRTANMVKFVCLKKPLAEILGERSDETARQNAATRLRDLIEKTTEPYSNDKLRIVPIAQQELWREGVDAGSVLAKSSETESALDTAEAQSGDGSEAAAKTGELLAGSGDYSAGKWGRFLRAPDIYFHLMREYGHRFVKLGEIAEIRRGITSGCDAFFMPRDVTDEVLADIRKGLPWRDVGLRHNCTLKEVEDGEVRIIRAGDKTLHPIESRFLRPEVHSLMAVDRPVIRAADINRVALWVSDALEDLSGTHVAKYIRWGAKHTFASSKSKAVPVPERSSCAGRPTWYDVTTPRIGVCFWPKAQKYRHIVPTNPDAMVCNCNLYTVVPDLVREHERWALAAILNSTVVGLLKQFYGRYAGAEGTLKTEVVDALLLAVPNPKGISESLAFRLGSALDRMYARPVTHLVEDSFLQCHSSEHLRLLLSRPPGLPGELQQEDRRELDLCVLELLGVGPERKRQALIGELYRETTDYYRYLRTQDIQSMENRAGGAQRRLTASDIAASIWDSLDADEQGPKLVEWLGAREGLETVEILDGKAQALGADHMFSPAGVDFVQGKGVLNQTYRGPLQAALVARLANLDIRGEVRVPMDEEICREWSKRIADRLTMASARFQELAADRAGSDKMRADVVSLLTNWFTHGRSNP